MATEGSWLVEMDCTMGHFHCRLVRENRGMYHVLRWFSVFPCFHCCLVQESSWMCQVLRLSDPCSMFPHFPFAHPQRNQLLYMHHRLNSRGNHPHNHSNSSIHLSFVRGFCLHVSCSSFSCHPLSIVDFHFPLRHWYHGADCKLRIGQSLKYVMLCHWRLTSGCNRWSQKQ